MKTLQSWKISRGINAGGPKITGNLQKKEESKFFCTLLFLGVTS